jgi:hypothetical protein
MNLPSYCTGDYRANSSLPGLCPRVQERAIEELQKDEPR